MPFAELSGRRVYYELHGEETAPPLLLVIGMGGSCRGWLPLQVPDFSKGHRTVIFDNRGVGQSDDPGGPFTTADLADDTVEFLDDLGIARTDALGIFMGGMILQELALRHPERLSHLVLAGTYARPDPKRRMLLEKWREMARAGTSDEVMVRERLLWTLDDETLEQSDLIEAMIEYWNRDGSPVSTDLFVRQCGACLSHDTTHRLSEVPHPTLLICGRNDLLTPPRLHRELAELLPNARLVTLSQAGHLAMVESAERFNHVVLQFLEEEL